MKYISREVRRLEIRNKVRHGEIDSKTILAAVLRCNATMKQISQFEVDIFEILGMRNLSAFVGEVFAAAMSSESPDLLLKNPHQDGYPDLLLLDKSGRELYEKLSKNLKDKSPFSPFATGGLEIKASVGSTPSPKVLSKKGLDKPAIGEQRIELLNGYDWKAHHRETNNLLGILWDFIEGIPCVTAVFYSSDLEESDWGKIVQPKSGGGRTTSVSIMTRSGISKMYAGWICVLEDSRYVNFVNKRNGQSLIQLPAN